MSNGATLILRGSDWNKALQKVCHCASPLAVPGSFAR